MKSRVLPLALLAASLPLVAAAASNPSSRRAAADKLALCHWWVSPSESAAIKAMVGVFNRRHPSVTVSSAEGEGAGVKMFAALKHQMAAGHTPDAFQMHAGAAIQPFRDAGLVNNLDGLWESEGLEKVMPVIVQKMNKLDGHYFAIPVDVHRNNLVWYNKPLLEKHGIDPATLTSWDAFLKAAETLREAGIKNPVQMGTMWTATHVLECIMASLGLGTYEDWINGKITSANDPRLNQAFTTFKRYLSYANDDHADTLWNVALERVAKGQGAFCIMGDWANGEFLLMGAKYGKEYGAFPVPGTRGTYGVTVDAFLQTHDSPSPTNSDQWMKVAASREGQDAFNSLKGSIPARTDPDVSRYDTYQRSAIADFKAARLYPSVGAVAPAAFVVKLDEIAALFARDRDVNAAASLMASTTARLESKFIRQWSLK